MSIENIIRKEKRIFKTFGYGGGIQLRFLKGTFIKDIGKYRRHKPISKLGLNI